MKEHSALFFTAFYLLGLVLLGFFAYMFDQVHPGRNKGKTGCGPLAWWAFVWQMGLFPFVYLAHGVEGKDWKAVGIFLVAFILLAVFLAAVVWWGNAT